MINKPSLINLLWLNSNLVLGSSPQTIDDHSLCLFSILIIASPKISYPLDAFNLPTNVIIFFFELRFIFLYSQIDL